MDVSAATTLDYDFSGQDANLTQASVGAYFSSDTSTPTDLSNDGPGSNGDYQQDAMWSHDNDEEEIIRIEYEKSKVPFIRRKDEVLNLQQNTLKMVVEPQKYTQGTMIHLRYAKVNEDPMEDPPRDKQVTEYMTADAAPLVADDAAGRRRGRPEHLAFPLMGKVQEIELGGLSKGWYLVCGEAVRTDDNVVLERDCLWARIFAQVQEEGRSKDFAIYIVIIVLMAVVSAAVIIGVAMAIYLRIKRERRKRIDKEMQDRVEAKARHERELSEKELQFKDVYIDPDEPYQERCIM